MKKGIIEITLEGNTNKVYKNCKSSSLKLLICGVDQYLNSESQFIKAKTQKVGDGDLIFINKNDISSARLIDVEEVE